MGSSPVRLVPHKKRRLGHRPAQREDHVKTRGEDGRLQTLDKGLGRNQLCRHLDLGHPASRARDSNCLLLSCPVDGSLLLLPEQLSLTVRGGSSFL